MMKKYVTRSGITYDILDESHPIISFTLSTIDSVDINRDLMQQFANSNDATVLNVAFFTVNGTGQSDAELVLFAYALMKCDVVTCVIKSQVMESDSSTVAQTIEKRCLVYLDKYDTVKMTLHRIDNDKYLYHRGETIPGINT